VADWLTSEAFDLKEARSLEAETAIHRALALLRGDLPRTEAADIDRELRATLGEHDRFWIRWSAFMETLQGP
jgi:hypothetical protein